MTDDRLEVLASAETEVPEEGVEPALRDEDRVESTENDEMAFTPNPVDVTPKSSDLDPSNDAGTTTGELAVLVIDAPPSSLDLDREHALATAIDALLGGGMGAQARPLARELRAIVEAAQGPRAKVIQLAFRARREP